MGSAHSALLVFVFCLGFLFGFGQRGIRRREGRFSLLHAVFIDRNSLLKKVKKNGFDPPYPVFFSKVPGCPAEFLCPTMPRVLARDFQCPPITTSSATRSNTIKPATPTTPPDDDHLHYQSATTYTTHRRQVIPPASDHPHHPPATSCTTSQRPPTLPFSLQHRLHHLPDKSKHQSATTHTTRRQPLALPVSDHLHYPMATTEDSESEVELQVAVTQGTEPGPGLDALFLGQQFATYTNLKATMCRWAVATHFETRYEKSEKAVNIVTCRVKECAFCARAMYRPKLECVVITKLIPEHIACVGTDLGNRRNVSKHKYQREAVPTIPVVDRETTPKDVIKAVQHKLHHKVSYKAARKVLRSCKKPILKQRESSSDTWEH